MTIDEFEQAWWAFVGAWAEAGGTGPRAEALIDAVLREGLQPVTTQPTEPNSATALECEIAVIARSGGFDERAYLDAFADAKSVVKNPLRQFCESGWRTVFNPRPDFDLWWYWFEHLDPAAERVNPLLHHLLAGQQAGLATLPVLYTS